MSLLTVGAKLQPRPGRTGAHTNTIEATCKHVKVFVKAYNRQKNHIYYLAEYMFTNLCRARDIDPFTMFLHVFRYVAWSIRPAHAYPPPFPRLTSK